MGEFLVQVCLLDKGLVFIHENFAGLRLGLRVQEVFPVS